VVLAELGRSLGVDGKTVGRYLDLLVDLLLVRRLPPLLANVGKRLVRSPKVLVRDSGLVHTVLGLGDADAVLGHPVAGASWEGFVIETLLAVAPQGCGGWFYRTAAGRSSTWCSSGRRSGAGRSTSNAASAPAWARAFIRPSPTSNPSKRSW